MKETELLETLKSKKPDKALRELYKSYPSIKNFIKKNGGNNTDAEDIFQDALVILIKNIQKENFTLTSALQTYLFSVCKYLWKTELTKRNKTVSFDSYNDSDLKFEDENLHLTTSKELLALKALDNLGERCWDLLKSFYYENKSMDELAQTFGFKSEKIAKNEKYKCLEKARQNYVQLSQKHFN
jgi:RNA polymerase sigma factor (sigma-70 family)